MRDTVKHTIEFSFSLLTMWMRFSSLFVLFLRFHSSVLHSNDAGMGFWICNSFTCRLLIFLHRASFNFDYLIGVGFKPTAEIRCQLRNENVLNIFKKRNITFFDVLTFTIDSSLQLYKRTMWQTKINFVATFDRIWKERSKLFFYWGKRKFGKLKKNHLQTATGHCNSNSMKIN